MLCNSSLRGTALHREGAIRFIVYSMAPAAFAQNCSRLLSGLIRKRHRRMWSNAQALPSTWLYTSKTLREVFFMSNISETRARPRKAISWASFGCSSM